MCGLILWCGSHTEGSVCVWIDTVVWDYGVGYYIYMFRKSREILRQSAKDGVGVGDDKGGEVLFRSVMSQH